jgi:predicted HTH domain antitoxin
MTTVTIELPETVFSALRLAPKDFMREMRIAAAVQWYAQQQISQGKAAEIAGLSRVEFLDELFKRRVPAIQITLEELEEEINGEW